MIVVETKNLNQAIASNINEFCQFAFSCTTFRNVIVRFEPFDPSNVTQACTDLHPLGSVVTYNHNQESSFETIIEVLAHESIHVHQLSDKRLQYAILKNKDSIEWGFLWEGEPYFYPKTAKEVMFLPWEVEAYEQSEKVINNFYKNKSKVA